MAIALSSHPISTDFKQSIEKQLSVDMQYTTLAELRKLSLPKMLRHLRANRKHAFYILLEDSSSFTLLPVMQIFALCSFSHTIFVINNDYKIKKISKIKSIVHALGLLTNSILAFIYTKLLTTKLRKLLSQSIVPIKIKSSKKALYLNTNLWFGVKAGGSIGHIAGVINGFSDKSIDVAYASFSENCMLKGNIEQMHLNPPKFFSLPTELNSYVINRKSHSQLETIFADTRPNFIYQRLVIGNYSGVELSRKHKIPLILEYNGSEVWIAENWGNGLRYKKTAELAENVCLQHAHIIVTISKPLREELINRGIDTNKIVCYPNCIDPDVFNPDNFTNADKNKLLEKYHIDLDSTILSFIGTFGRWHGVTLLAECIKQLIENDSEWLQKNKAHFLLIGDGLMMPQVKQIIGKYIHSSYVTLTGLIPQQEAPNYLAASDIFLSPHVRNDDGSKFFGSPTKLFEYMAMGKGIIAADLDQVGDVLAGSLQANNLPVTNSTDNNNELAVLFEPGNKLQFIKAIKFLVENKHWRDQLGLNARNEALSKYTWENHVDRILARITAQAH